MGRLPGSTYRVMKRFRVRLRPTPLKRESPEWFAQRALDRDIARLRAVTPALHRLHPVASALTAPMRMCSVHKLMLPTSVMLRFVRAYRPDGTAMVAFDHFGQRAGKGVWVSACWQTVQYAAEGRYGRGISLLSRMLVANPTKLDCRTDMPQYAANMLRGYLATLCAVAFRSGRALFDARSIRDHVRVWRVESRRAAAATAAFVRRANAASGRLLAPPPSATVGAIAGSTSASAASSSADGVDDTVVVSAGVQSPRHRNGRVRVPPGTLRAQTKARRVMYRRMAARVSERDVGDGRRLHDVCVNKPLAMLCVLRPTTDEDAALILDVVSGQRGSFIGVPAHVPHGVVSWTDVRQVLVQRYGMDPASLPESVGVMAVPATKFGNTLYSHCLRLQSLLGLRVE